MAVAHFDGSSWSLEHAGTGLQPTWSTGDGALWSTGPGGLFRRSADAWDLALPLPASHSVSALWGDESGTIVVVGVVDTTVNPQLGIIEVSDGSTWAQVSPENGIPADMRPVHAIWGYDARDVYVVGEAGMVLHFDGTSWQRERIETATPLVGVAGLARGEPVAVGSEGIFARTPATAPTP